MQVVNRYIFLQVSGAIAIVLFIVFGLDIIFRLVNELSQLRNDYTFLKALYVVLLGAPLQFYSVMPMIGMIGCLAGLGVMANSNELIILRATGLSTIKLTAIALKPTLLFLFSAMLIGEYVAPKSELKADTIKKQAKYGIARQNLKGVFWVRDRHQFIYVNIITPDNRLLNVNIFSYDPDLNLSLYQRADEAIYDENTGWKLINVTSINFVRDQEPNKLLKRFEASMLWDTRITLTTLKNSVIDPRELPLIDLIEHIDQLENQQGNPIAYQLAFWEKVYYPFLAISLILIGIAFVFGPLRSVTMGFRLFCGILVGVVVKTIQSAVGPISLVYGMPPFFAMALPFLVCMFIGLFLLSRIK